VADLILREEMDTDNACVLLNAYYTYIYWEANVAVSTVSGRAHIWIFTFNTIKQKKTFYYFVGQKSYI
jgi:hypothetical protein